MGERMSFTRRNLLAFGSGLGLTGSLASIAEATDQPGTPLRVRQNITEFAQDPGKVSALRKAVGRMKDKSKANPHDPYGWAYWAAIHGTTEAALPNLDKIYNQCDHSYPGYVAQHFLSWHRAYLYFFETVLKKAASEIPGAVDFELPYWDWYSTPRMPEIFVTDNGATNPLWNRRTIVDLSGATLKRNSFGKAAMLPGGGTPPKESFSWLLEADPHGAIHGLIGGDMGFVTSSARDPIFWLHHANIDRLWTAWMKAKSRTLPPEGSSWHNASWKYDAAGTWTQRAGEMLDQSKLGYRYDDESMPVHPAVPVAQVPSMVVLAQAAPVPAGSPSAATTMGAEATSMSATAAPVALASGVVAVELKIAPQNQGKLIALSQTPAASPITTANIVLEDVEVSDSGKQGGFGFDVVVSTVTGARVSIGTINTFTLSALDHGGGHAGHNMKRTLRFSLPSILGDLGVKTTAGLANGLTVAFVPVHPQSTDPKAFVTIGAVRIQASSQPIQ